MAFAALVSRRAAWVRNLAWISRSVTPRTRLAGLDKTFCRHIALDKPHTTTAITVPSVVSRKGTGASGAMTEDAATRASHKNPPAMAADRSLSQPTCLGCSKADTRSQRMPRRIIAVTSKYTFARALMEVVTTRTVDSSKCSTSSRPWI